MHAVRASSLRFHFSRIMKTSLFWLGLMFIAVSGAWMIRNKESILTDGRTVFLELAPRDPRSLMQGDYMVLRYKIATDAPKDKLQRRGQVVVRLDDRNVGTFARLGTDQPASSNEVAIDYRNYGGLEIGAESYFFQERTGKTFEQAKYAQLKVSPAGECLLVALHDGNLQLLKHEDVAQK